MCIHILFSRKQREGRKSHCNEIYVSHKHAAVPLANKAQSKHEEIIILIMRKREAISQAAHYHSHSQATITVQKKIENARKFILDTPLNDLIYS